MKKYYFLVLFLASNLLAQQVQKDIKIQLVVREQKAKKAAQDPNMQVIRKDGKKTIISKF